ncbi:MAG: hypothetical protein CL908_20700 [Deltaproteobacteria bacterium]|jgi:hypothetical membrane protein|nr:hypothetical protein [Deltaproteobacteria bacterium]
MTAPVANRVAVMVGVGALVLDFVIPFAIALAQPGYSHMSQYISELSVPGQPLAHLMAYWWFVYGVCLLVLAAALRVALPATTRGFRCLPWLIAIAGLGLGVGGGLFPCEAGCATESLRGQAHAAFGLLGSLAFVIAPFTVWHSLRARSETRALAAFTMAAACVGIFVFGAGLEASSPGSAREGIRGLWQRLSLLVSYVWVAALAIYAHREYAGAYSKSGRGVDSPAA